MKKKAKTNLIFFFVFFCFVYIAMRWKGVVTTQKLEFIFLTEYI